MSTSALSPSRNDLMPFLQPGRLATGEHVVYFYSHSDSLLQALCENIGHALKSGYSAVVIATKMHREGLQRRLTARGLDLANASKRRQYVELDASETLSKFMVDGQPDARLFEEVVGGAIAGTDAVVNSGPSEIVAFGEMVSVLWLEGKADAAVRLEQLWNDLAKKYSFSLRCAYPIATFLGAESAHPLMRVCAEHSAILLDETETSIAAGESKIALRRSEERFRLLVDAVQDYAIFMLDERGHISSWNKGAQRIKGYGVSEIIGKHFSIFYPEEDIVAGKPQRHLEIAAAEGRLEDEGWRLRKDGSRFWANVVISAIRNEAGTLIGYGKVTRDVTDKIQAKEMLLKEILERTEAQKRLSDSENSLRQLSLRLLQTQDEERRRIGRDLHDSVGQYLVGLKMKVDSFTSARERGQQQDAGELTECSQLIDEAIKEVRTISYLLYPPMLEELGLKSAILWYLDGFTKRSGITTTFEVSPDFDRIPQDLELALFRVLQEGLTNVHRHSGSLTASVQLRNENQTIVLQVSDLGTGAHSSNLESLRPTGLGPIGVGLRGMDERVRQVGGALEISCSPSGTTITARIPLPGSGAKL